MCSTNRDTDADGHAQRDTHSDTDAHGDQYTHTYTDTHRHQDTDRYQHPHGHANTPRSLGRGDVHRESPVCEWVLQRHRVY
jgi:hypothetical protein